MVCGAVSERTLEQNRMGRRDWLPVEWLGLGLEVLKAAKTDEELFRNKMVKERLLDAMAAHNVDALVEHARKHAGIGDDEVAKRLGLHRGTPIRWIKGRSQPHARLFFGVLVLGLRKEINEVSLPRRKEVIWEAVSRTLALIRERECGKDYRRPRQEEFACLRYLMRHPWGGELALGKEEANLSHVRKVLEDVGLEVNRLFPCGALGSLRAVKDTIDDWADAYALFRLGLPSDWEFLDEYAA